MNSKEIFRALQAGEINSESAEYELKKMMNTITPLPSLSHVSKEEACKDISSKSKTDSVVTICEIDSGIVKVTMQDRVHKNAFSVELVDELTKTFQDIAANSNYKVVILTGYDSYFASGGTKEGLLAIQEGKVKFTDLNIYSLALECPIPVIAAMQGHGIGAGWSMGMFCDFIVMSKESYYASNYMKYGFTPGAGSTLIFPEKLGMNLAQEILYTGRQFRGSELKEKGVSVPILPRKEVLPYAIELAKELAQAPRESLVALKKLLAKSSGEKLANVYENELEMHEKTFVNQLEVKQRIESIFQNIPNNKGREEALKASTNKRNINPEAGTKPASVYVDKTLYSVEKKGHTQVDQDEQNAIAIIGMAGQFPKSNSLDEFWNNLAQGVDCISEVPNTRWSTEAHYSSDPKVPRKSYSKWMGVLEEADKFDPLFFNISPNEAELMDPQQRLFLENCWHCIEDAGLSASSLSGSRCGVFVGCAPNEYGQSLIDQGENAQGFMGAATSILSARISYLLNLKGPSLAIDTACSSSLMSIAEACNSLILKNCDMALAGGVYVVTGPSMHIMTSKAGMLSKDGKCFTFDGRANGFVPGEGVGVVLLKRLPEAVRDGDPIHGVIRGWGTNQDGKTNGITAPSVNSQILLEQEVYERFKINPETISLIEAHGTATKLGDPIEVEALTTSFQSYTQKKNYCALGSVKSNIGHLLTAAGISGVIKVLLALKHKMLPPTINFETLNEHISLDNSPFFVNTKLQPWKVALGTPRRAGVSSFGFSGTNAHLIIEEYIPENTANHSLVPVDKEHSILFVLSAKSKEQLKTYARRIKDWIEAHENSNLQDIAYTLQTGREEMDFRIAFPAYSIEDLLQTLEGFIDNDSKVAVLANQVRNSINRAIAFQEDEDAQSLLESWIEKRELTKIAELWVNGLKIDWSSLYGTSTPRRINLPTYPFLKESYWIPADYTTRNRESVSQTDQAIITDSQSPKFNNLLDLSSKGSNSTNNGTEEMLSFSVSYFTNVLSMVLKIDPKKLDAQVGFDNYGLDSIVVQRLNGILEEVFGEIPSTIFFTYKCIRDLAQYFIDEHEETVRRLFYQEKNSQHINLGKDEKDQQMDTYYVKKKLEAPSKVTLNENNNANFDIAIVGMSGQYPQSNNIYEFWKNLESGADCIVEIPKERWDYRKYYNPGDGNHGKTGGMYCKWGGFIPDVDKFDPSFFQISPLEARYMDPQERLFLQTVSACFEDAGYSRMTLKDKGAGDGRASIGVFAGVTYNNYQLHLLKEYDKGNFVPINSQIYSIANRISYIYNLRGPSLSVDTACSSSLYAIHLACESIKRGECEMAIAGGVNLSLHPSKYVSLCVSQFASSDGRCRSFGEGGDGYVPGEGVGAVLLKPLTKAVADGDHIYSVIKGTAVNNDGRTFGYSVPNPVAQTEVIQEAMDKGKIDPRTISYVEAHGTGTKLGDPIEITGLSNAFKDYTSDKQYCAIGSVKSNIGHLEAASGIAQITKVSLQMKHKKLVPSLLHTTNLNPNIDFENTPFFVQRTLEDWKETILSIKDQEVVCPRRAGISSFGAGGVNVHVILEEYQVPYNNERDCEKDEDPVVIVLSAKRENNLHSYAKKLKDYFEKRNHNLGETAKLKDIAYTLQTGRDPMPHRLAFTARNEEEIIEKINIFLNQRVMQGKNPFYVGHVVSENEIKTEDDRGNSVIDLDKLETLEKIAELWTLGRNIEWTNLYKNNIHFRVPLPTYPFSQERYWVEEQIIEELTYEESTRPIDTLQSGKEKNTSENSTFLYELVEAMEGDRLEMIEMYVQDLLSKLLAFNSPELPEIHQGFFDMGMESVMAEQFRSLLEQTFKIEISDTAVFDYPNISELSCYILEIIPFLELESQSLHFHDSQKENSLLEDIALLDSNNLNEVHEMPLEEVVDELKALLNE